MKDDRDKAAYIDPVKAEEERAKGNELFKEGKWVEAIKTYTEGISDVPAMTPLTQSCEEWTPTRADPRSSPSPSCPSFVSFLRVLKLAHL